MSTGANVQSLEAIEAVRSALTMFIDQVADALTELNAEMRRVSQWLEHDRPRYWKNQVRLAGDQAHAAQQALHRCLMFPIADERPSCYEERAALKMAHARLAYCQEKADRVRHWQRTVQHEMFEYEGRISQLLRLVEIDVPQAIGVLQRILRHLIEYQTLRASNPRSAFNDLALAQDLWPGKAASAAGTAGSESGAALEASSDADQGAEEKADA